MNDNDTIKELTETTARSKWWDKLLAALITALVGYALGLLTRGGI